MEQFGGEGGSRWDDAGGAKGSWPVFTDPERPVPEDRGDALMLIHWSLLR